MVLYTFFALKEIFGQVICIKSSSKQLELLNILEVGKLFELLNILEVGKLFELLNILEVGKLSSTLIKFPFV
jgi:hypothetical protein